VRSIGEAMLYDHPVLIIDPGMHTAPSETSAWTRQVRVPSVL